MDMALFFFFFYPIPPPPMRRVCERAPQPMRVAAAEAPCSQITARPLLRNQIHVQLFWRISRLCDFEWILLMMEDKR